MINITTSPYTTVPSNLISAAVYPCTLFEKLHIFKLMRKQFGNEVIVSSTTEHIEIGTALINNQQVPMRVLVWVYRVKDLYVALVIEVGEARCAPVTKAWLEENFNAKFFEVSQTAEFIDFIKQTT